DRVVDCARRDADKSLGKLGDQLLDLRMAGGGRTETRAEPDAVGRVANGRDQVALLCIDERLQSDFERHDRAVAPTAGNGPALAIVLGLRVERDAFPRIGFRRGFSRAEHQSASVVWPSFPADFRIVARSV